MSDEKTSESPAASAGEPGGGAGAAQAVGTAEAVGGETASEAPVEQAPGSSGDIERLESEKADLTDRLLRLAADMDNLRRRTERELIDARKYAVQKFAADMLVVGDNLKRALDAVPEEQRQSGDQVAKALFDGVEMTAREMDRLLEKNGVTRIAAMGERFDPNRHQAVFEVPDADAPAGTVVMVMQEGFTIGDRVLRAAMVGVSKGGGRPAEEATERQENTAS